MIVKNMKQQKQKSRRDEIILGGALWLSTALN